MFKPIFNGRLLRLAVPQPGDAERLAEWSQDDEYMRMLDDDPVRPLTDDFFRGFGDPKDSTSYYFHLRTLEEDKFIGFVVLHTIKWASRTSRLAIGIGHPGYRGKGYGADALRLIIRYAFAELNLNRIELTVMDYNTAAIKAYDRVGFVREGVMRQAVRREGRYADMLLYGLISQDWQDST